MHLASRIHKSIPIVNHFLGKGIVLKLTTNYVALEKLEYTIHYILLSTVDKASNGMRDIYIYIVSL
jgi:hypothetical protein